MEDVLGLDERLVLGWMPLVSIPLQLTNLLLHNPVER